jgi:hypothetical protein
VHHCGCGEFPLIGQLSAEHEVIATAAGRLHRAITRGEADPVAALEELLPHTASEEQGLFPAAVFALPVEAWDRVTPDHASDHHTHRSHQHHNQPHHHGREQHAAA